MTRDQAKELLAANPAANVKMVDKDATRKHYVYRSVWIDEAGELVMAHPTDPRGVDILAPQNASYQLMPREEPEEDTHGRGI
jgi:hypothetical protein